MRCDAVLKYCAVASSILLAFIYGFQHDEPSKIEPRSCDCELLRLSGFKEVFFPPRSVLALESGAHGPEVALV